MSCLVDSDTINRLAENKQKTNKHKSKRKMKAAILIRLRILFVL